MNDDSRPGEPYRVGSLKHDQVAKAFVLIEQVVRDLTFSQWLAYYKESAGSGDSQIVVATDPAGYVRGLCVAGPPPDRSGTLEVPVFAATSAADPAGVEQALLNHLKELARSRSYSALRVWTLDAGNWRRFVEEKQPPDHNGSLLVML
jgi:hypothetical protein